MSCLMPASTPQNASQIKDVHDRTSSAGRSRTASLGINAYRNHGAVGRSSASPRMAATFLRNPTNPAVFLVRAARLKSAGWRAANAGFRAQTLNGLTESALLEGIVSPHRFA